MNFQINRSSTNSRFKSKFFVILSLTFSLLVFLFFGIYSILKISKQQQLQNESTFKYQHLQFSPVHKKTSIRTVTLPKRIEDRESSFFKDSQTGDLHLISEIGSRQYTCTGSCICQQEEDDRKMSTTTTTLTKGIYFLVAGFSVIVAKNYAQKYFQEECQERFSTTSSCPLDSIYGEVEECVAVQHQGHSHDVDHFNLDDIYEVYQIKKLMHEGDYKTKNFLCKGKCINNPYAPMESVECEKFVVEDFHIYVMDTEYTQEVGLAHAAEAKFVGYKFMKFCLDMRPEAGLDNDVSAYCLATRGGVNPSIKCVENTEEEEEQMELPYEINE